MASWSTRRKYGYLFIFLAFLLLLVGTPAFFFLYKAPTCFDNKQNGNERGVDCGGSCAKLCPADFTMPRVLWSYTMKVVPEIYNAMAYVQNANQGAEARFVPYAFKFYDSKGDLISQRTGMTFVPAGQKFSVFEGGINMGVKIPSRTTFEFTEVPAWVPGQVLTRLKVINPEVTEGDQPRAQAIVKNETVDTSFSNIEASIILYDENDNRVAFSKTVIEYIAPEESKNIVFDSSGAIYSITVLEKATRLSFSS
jgi:hypothetical protein